MVRDLHAAQAQHGGREIHEADQAVGGAARRSRCEVPIRLWKSHQQRFLQAGVPKTTLAARQAHAVVAVEEHDRVAGQSVFRELLQKRARFLVHRGEAIVVTGPRAAGLGRVRVIRWQRRLGGIVAFLRRHLSADFLLELFMRIDARSRLVGGHEVEHGEERLPRLAPPPVRARRALVPTVANEGAFVAQVVVRLHVVGGVVARLAQQGRETADMVWNRELRPQPLRPERCRIHPGDEARAGGRADWRGGEGARVADALAGERVEARRARVGVTITTEVRADVLGGDPEDIGLASLFSGGEEWTKRRQQKDDEEGKQDVRRAPEEPAPRAEDGHAPPRRRIALGSVHRMG